MPRAGIALFDTVCCWPSVVPYLTFDHAERANDPEKKKNRITGTALSILVWWQLPCRYVAAKGKKGLPRLSACIPPGGILGRDSVLAVFRLTYLDYLDNLDAAISGRIR